jgi:hypothetical protein
MDLVQGDRKTGIEVGTTQLGMEFPLLIINE